jgi:hypothetical protein
VTPAAGERNNGDRARESAVLAKARTLVASSTGAVLILAAASGLVEPGTSVPALGPPAALAGLVSPLLGYRLFALLRERTGPGAGHAARCDRFLRATLFSVAVGAGVALFGIVAFWLSSVVAALIGVVTLVILVGALWPTEEKLEGFFDDAATSAGEAG